MSARSRSEPKFWGGSYQQLSQWPQEACGEFLSAGTSMILTRNYLRPGKGALIPKIPPTIWKYICRLCQKRFNKNLDFPIREDPRLYQLYLPGQKVLIKPLLIENTGLRLLSPGMFLFSYLVMDNLLNQTTEEELDNELQPGVFPAGLGEA